MKRRLAIILVITMIAAILGGCSGKDAGQSDVIKIGVNLELTGPLGSTVSPGYNGIKLAVKQINDNGGVNGKKIELVVADDKSESTESINAATKLLTQDGVCAVIGPAASSNAIAALQVHQDNGVPIIVPAGTAEKITVDESGKVRPYSFRGCFNDAFFGKMLAEFCAKNLKVSNVALYIDNSSDYSKGIAAAFKADAQKCGVKVVAEEAYIQKDQDFKATLTKLRSAKPEAVIIPGYAQEVSQIVKQARELGMNIPLLGADGWDDPSLVKIAGAANMNNTFFANHYSSQDTDPGIVKFIGEYKKEFNAEPNFCSLVCYDAVYILADAIKRAGSSDPKKITEALAATKDLQVASGKFSYDENHNAIKSVVIIEYKDGQQVMRARINP